MCHIVNVCYLCLPALSELGQPLGLADVRFHVTTRANIKVSSTETGAIFGNIVYEATGYSDRSVVSMILLMLVGLRQN